MRRSMIFSACVLLFLMGSVLLPSANAEIFKIGNIISETDPEKNSGDKFYYFSSGCIVESKDEYIDSGIKILDGNTSTGIAKFFGYHFYSVSFKILFPSPIFINNITTKPKFGGNASDYRLTICVIREGIQLTYEINEEKTFKINGIINGNDIGISEKLIQLSNISVNYTGYAYFNAFFLSFIL